MEQQVSLWPVHTHILYSDAVCLITFPYSPPLVLIPSSSLIITLLLPCPLPTPRDHIWQKICDICHFEPGLFPVTWWSLLLTIFLPMTQSGSFLWWSSAPLFHGCFYSLIHAQACRRIPQCGYCQWINLGVQMSLEYAYFKSFDYTWRRVWLDHMIVLYCFFEETKHWFSY